MQECDHHAVTRLKEGDIGGLEVLVRRYQLRAVHAAYLVVRDRSAAEDIVQSAFLRAYERIGQFDSGRPFGPWFLRGVVNDAVKAVARDKRNVSLDRANGAGDGEIPLAASLVDPNPGPQQLAEQDFGRRQVWAALAKLSPQQRAAIVLRYYLDLGEGEMAQRLACPQGTIKRRLHDARQRLRRLLMPEARPDGRDVGHGATR